MTEIEAINTLSYLLGYENAVDKGELEGENHLNSQEKEALKFILDKVQQYKAIGTVEEFKALKEKNEPKRLLTREEKYPQNYGIYSTSDRWCPCCRGLVFTGDWSVHKQNIMYKRIRCGCGQKLDWQ